MILILIESDLLLASVKKEDRFKPLADKILDRIDSGRLKGVYASIAAIQEIVFWLYNLELLSELVTVVDAFRLAMKTSGWSNEDRHCMSKRRCGRYILTFGNMEVW